LRVSGRYLMRYKTLWWMAGTSLKLREECRGLGRGTDLPGIELLPKPRVKMPLCRWPPEPRIASRGSVRHVRRTRCFET